MRHGAAFIILLLSCALLGGCAQESDETEKVRKVGPPLTAKQVQRALLTKQDLGRKFVLDKSRDDDDISHKDCMNKSDRLVENGPQPLREKTLKFEAHTKLQVPEIQTTVATFATVKAATRSLDLMASTLENCKRVSYREDGARYVFQIGVSELALAKEADQQVTITAAANVSVSGLRLKMILEISTVRIGRNAIMVTMVDISDSLAGARRDLTDAAVDRLLAVMDGEKLPKPESVLADYPLVSPKDLQPSL